MDIEDDEILQGFIEESLEHLADIENDLLAMVILYHRTPRPPVVIKYH